jgi:hypothetical protein
LERALAGLDAEMQNELQLLRRVESCSCMRSDLQVVGQVGSSLNGNGDGKTSAYRPGCIWI